MKRNSWSPEEFAKLMEPWDEKMKAIAQHRIVTNYSKDQLEHYTAEEAVTMAMVLDRLIPQEESVDLVGFLDSSVGKKYGRGDKKKGVPDEPELFKLGFRGLDETAESRFGRRFSEVETEQQDEILRDVEEGKVHGGSWEQAPPEDFFEQFYRKALLGYYSHPRVWMRIGFMGAAYPEGYAWLGRAQVLSRRERAPGWERM